MVIKKEEYHQENRDHTLFVKIINVILLVYIDNIIVMGDDKEEVVAQKRWLAVEFDFKDMDKGKYFLRIETAMSKTGLVLNKTKCVSLLKKPWNLDIELCLSQLRLTIR